MTDKIHPLNTASSWVRSEKHAASHRFKTRPSVGIRTGMRMTKEAVPGHHRLHARPDTERIWMKSSQAAGHCIQPTNTSLSATRQARKTNPKGSLSPRAHKECPQASALRLCSPPPRCALSTPLRSVSRVGDPPPLALATPCVRHVAFGICIKCRRPTT